jgi:rod shape-determining protein MreD
VREGTALTRVEDPASLRSRILPASTVLIAACLTFVPVVASLPLMPPLGLLTLLAWRLLRRDVFRIWAPVPLGFFDDLVSGQPLGSAVLLWTLCFFLIDLIDRRLLWRDFKQDWLIGSLLAGCVIAAGALVARAPSSSTLFAALGVQWLLSAAALPLVMRSVAALDRWRLR